MSADADVTNDPGAGPDPGLQWLRLDPRNDIPVVSTLLSTGQAVQALIEDPGERQELFAIAGGVADLALNVVVYLADPLNYLLTAGLSFLVDVVQPLADLIGLVSGNPERMAGEIAKWVRVGDALGPLADEIRSAANEGLVGWQGLAADAARARLNQFADGVASLTADVDQLKLIMDIIRTLMETAEQLIISLIATFVEWLIFTWVPALAAAAPTLGASTAAAGAATTIEAGVATSRAAMFIQRVARIIMRLRRILYQMHPRLMRRAQIHFQLRSTGGFLLSGWVPKQVPMVDLMTDWRTWVPPGVKLVTGLVGDATSVPSGSRPLSGVEQDRALDQDE